VAYVDAVDTSVVVPVQLHVKQLIVGRVVAARRPSVTTIMREHRRARGGRGGGAHHSPLTRGRRRYTAAKHGTEAETEKKKSRSLKHGPDGRAITREDERGNARLDEK